MYKTPFLTQSPLFFVIFASANVLNFENWGRAPAYVLCESAIGNETEKQHIGNDRDVNDMNLMNLYPIILCCFFFLSKLGSFNSTPFYPAFVFGQEWEGVGQRTQSCY